MNAAWLEQTETALTRRIRRWIRRLQLAESLVWLPRGLIAGLLVAVGIALGARLRPWLLPEQAASLALGAVGLGGGLALAAVWLWPRPTARMARAFDRRFGLQERVSTALELIGGRIPMPEPLAEHQLNDALRAASGVNAAVWLPLRVRLAELIALAALAGLLAFLLLAPNPRADDLRAQQALEQALAEQAAELEATIREIERDESLSEAERAALTEPLEATRETLRQPGVTQQEAVAALAEAGRSLEELSEGMLPDQRQAYEQAAEQLAGSSLTQPLADALSPPDLGSAAEATDDLAQALEESELSAAEREDLAERLDAAAEQVEENNPALAEQLREAAEALREGDMEAAQEALREAARTLDQQQEQLENSPLARQAEGARQQASESQRALAQSGRRVDAEAQPQAAQGAMPQQPGDQPGDQAGAETGQGQAAQEGEGEAQAGQGQPDGPPQGQVGAADGQPQGAGEGDPQASGEGQPGMGGNTGPGAEGAPGGQGGAQQGASQSGEGGSQGQSSAAGAGEGQGGAGSDTTTGPQQAGSGPPSSGGGGDVEGEPGEYESDFAPSTIGGQSQQQIDVGGEATDPGSGPVLEGELGPNPGGESSLSYSDVYGDYQGAVSDALDSARIPLEQRDVIHDYFSALEP